jgi:UDP-N-acetylglucosamine--N-acetylmuramyl-(pentapeptide) pyrophosphoryl-undecaprenol N-acetylglucosamine transferase
LNLDPSKHTLLVMGGSRGARGINDALLAALPELVAGGVQVLHITGTLDWPEIETEHAALDDSLRANYHVFPYRSDIEQLFAAADLIISRAGAATMAEYPQFGLPAILVPYPYAWRYQKVNADYLAEHGAAIRLDQERLAAELLPTVRSLFDDPARLDAMRAAAAALRQPDGAANIAHLLAEVAGHAARGR